MSFHLVDCAAQVTIPHPDDPTRAVPLEPSWKLVLMRFADSADEQTRIGFPGMTGVLAWSGLSRSRAYEVINELEQLGLLRKHRSGGNGRRAEYAVLPLGCCPIHGPLASEEHIAGAGSGPSDPSHGAGSDPSDPDAETAAETTPGSDASDPQGPTDRTRRVRPGSDPGRTPSTSSTPTTGGSTTYRPRDDAPLDEHGPTTPHCADHPDGTPLACTACRRRREGFEKAEPKRAAARRRADSQAAIQADRQRKGQTEDVDAAAHAKAARELLAKTRDQEAS